MSAASRSLSALLWTLVAALRFSGDATAQFASREATGQFYRVAPPPTTQRYFTAVAIERVAPRALAMPAPVEPVQLDVPLRALTGQILELPERQRIYITAADADGSLRLFEIDLLARQARQVTPRPGEGPPYAARVLVAPDASKLYVQWLSPGFAPYTDIYDGQTLLWLGRTSEFQPDERAAGFEHRPPYLWTLDSRDRPVLVDTQRDRVVRRFDYRRRFGPVYAAVADAWRDLILVRLELGRDRYQVVDIVSGETGPPLDLEGYRRAQARLVLGGRVLVLIDMERQAPRPRRTWSETAIATGGGAIYDLRSGRALGEFRLIVPPALPVAAVGTHADPGLPGRLWIHVPGDYQRFDLELPACNRKGPRGDRVAAQVEARWDAPADPLRYGYRVRVSAASDAAVGALAIESGRVTERTAAPDGWGVDLIKRDRWVRWTNGLGPSSDDIAPGTARSGFVIAAKPGTRPGIAAYRIQAATGLARGCESDDRFLKNSARGYIIAPERVESDEPRKLAQRLKRLVERACDIQWIEASECAALLSSAARVESARTNRLEAAQRFLERLSRTTFRDRGAAVVLSDAVSAVIEALEP